jgi:hypothetical protein
MRFADRFLGVLDDSTAEICHGTGSPETRALAQRFKVDQVSSAVSVAAGPNPTVNLVDMMVMLRLQSHFLKDYWVPVVFGERARPLLSAYQRLEEEIWAMSKNVLETQQLGELKKIIAEWIGKNPEAHPTGHIPFHLLAREAGSYPKAKGRPTGSLFGLLFIDPLAGLDPTRQAIESSQYLAERSMFYLQHMPRILQEQTQQTFLNLAQTPEMVSIQAQAERLTQTAEGLAQATDKFPAQFRQERTAAVRQILEGVSEERARFLQQIVDEQAELQTSLKELRETFAMGKEMAANVRGAGDALAGFVHQIDLAQSRPSRRPDSRPFDVRDYGNAARDIGVGAEQVTTFLKSVEGSGSQVSHLLRQTKSQADEWADRTLTRALLVGSLLVLQVLCAVLVYRFLVERVIRGRWNRSVESKNPASH